MSIKATSSVTIADISDGLDGTGISSTKVEYQAGSSGTSAPTGTWSTSVPSTSASAPYLWTRVTYTYSDGRDPVYVYSVGSTPEGIEIGGRNLYLGTKDFSGDVWVVYTSDGSTIPSKYLIDNGYNDFTVFACNFNWSGYGQKLQATVVGETYTFSAWIKRASGYTGGIILYTETGGYGYSKANIHGYHFKECVEGKWVRVKKTFTVISVPEDTNKQYLNVRIESDGYSGLSSESDIRFYICGIKLEKGNKDTDWTPAPEDTEESITKVKTIAEQTADKFNWLVKSGTSATNFELTDRTANLVANHINLNGLVTFSGLNSDAQNKINSAENAVNNLEIGGRNYFRKNVKYYAIGDTYTDGSVEYPVFNQNNSDCPNGFQLIGTSTSTSNPPVKRISTVRLNNLIDSNGNWTISFLVRGSQNVSVDFYIDVCDSERQEVITTNDNSWKKYELTFYVTNYSINPAIYHFIDLSNIYWAYIYIKDFKVEKGNKATDWTPAPEDAEESINNVDEKAQGIIDNIYTTNTTTIDGGKITTGSIKAEKINVKDLFAQDITATNLTMSGTSKFGSCEISEYGDLVNGKSHLGSAGIEVTSYDPHISSLITENGFSVLDNSGKKLHDISINTTDGLTFEFGKSNQFTLTNKNMTFGSDGVFVIGEPNKKALSVHTKKFNDTSVTTDGIASTSGYGMTKLSSSASSTSTELAATSSAVKTAYDKAKSAFSGKGLPWAEFGIIDNITYTSFSEQAPSLTLLSSYSGDRTATFRHGGAFYIYCPFAGRVEINFNLYVGNVSSNGYLYARCYGYQYASDGSNVLLDFTGMGAVTSSGSQTHGTLVAGVKAGKYIYIVFCSSVSGTTDVSNHSYNVRLQYRNIYD